MDSTLNTFSLNTYNSSKEAKKEYFSTKQIRSAGWQGIINLKCGHFIHYNMVKNNLSPSFPKFCKNESKNNSFIIVCNKCNHNITHYTSFHTIVNNDVSFILLGYVYATYE